MTRGCGHRDEPLIAERRAAGVYEDPRSYVSTDGREYLFGIDKVARYREVWDRDERRCVDCSRSLTFEEMHPHHVIRRSAGGSDDALNLVTLCGSCHMFGPDAKHA